MLVKDLVSFDEGTGPTTFSIVLGANQCMGDQTDLCSSSELYWVVSITLAQPQKEALMMLEQTILYVGDPCTFSYHKGQTDNRGSRCGSLKNP